MLQYFAPITKINESKRTIEGVLALEVVDKDGEIMDYASSKKYFEEWSKEVHKNSGGKSVGNLREMHTRKAAGKFTELTFDDDNKRVLFEAEVVDDDSWKKVESGVLNGVSIGGDYVKKWKDVKLKAKRYTVKPCEGSLVDNPNMWGATFEIVKMDGASEVRKFKGNSEVSQEWKCHHGTHYYPTKAEAVHCEEDADSTIEKTVDSELEFQNSDTHLEKSLYDVSSLASTLSSLKYINPGDNNKTKFNKAIKNLISVLGDMVKDEKGQLDLTKSKEGDKEMSKIVKKAKEKVQDEEEEVEETETQETEEESEEEEGGENVEKLVTGALNKFFKSGNLRKVISGAIKEELDEQLGEMREDIEALGEAVTGLKKKPAPSKAVSKVVDSKRDKDEARPVKKSKEAQEIENAPDKTSNREELLGLMKIAQSKPIVIRDEDPNDEEEDNEENEE